MTDGDGSHSSERRLDTLFICFCFAICSYYIFGFGFVFVCIAIMADGKRD
jgi:hypothetical protein